MFCISYLKTLKPLIWWHDNPKDLCIWWMMLVCSIPTSSPHRRAFNRTATDNFHLTVLTWWSVDVNHQLMCRALLSKTSIPYSTRRSPMKGKVRGECAICIKCMIVQIECKMEYTGKLKISLMNLVWLNSMTWRDH